MAKKMIETVRELVEKRGISPYLSPDGSSLQFTLLHGSLFTVMIRCDEEDRLATVVVPMQVQVEADHHHEFCEWVVRANHRLKLGRFEYDVENVQVWFVVGLPISARLSRRVLDRAISLALGVARDYGPGAAAVGQGLLHAAAAIAKVEGPNRGQDDEVEFAELMDRLYRDEHDHNPEDDYDPFRDE